MLLAPIVALVIFLYILNVERDKGTLWGDCFLRAITRSIIAYVVGCLVEAIAYTIVLVITN